VAGLSRVHCSQMIPFTLDQRSKMKFPPLWSYFSLLAPDFDTSSIVALLMYPGNREV
jgi:hypothetical protein